ncbi:MAG: hypothetical protein IBX40_13020, partial [Methanosarcinales archaeon]|nr:hypothetical protein [Methanosarcinales archaeon]
LNLIDDLGEMFIQGLAGIIITLIYSQLLSALSNEATNIIAGILLYHGGNFKNVRQGVRQIS